MQLRTRSLVHSFLGHLSIFGAIFGQREVSLHMKNTDSQSLVSGKNHLSTCLLKEKQGLDQGSMPTFRDVSEQLEATQGFRAIRQQQHNDNHDHNLVGENLQIIVL